MSRALKLTAANITGRRGTLNPAVQNLAKISPKAANVIGTGHKPAPTSAKLTGKPLK